MTFPKAAAGFPNLCLLHIPTGFKRSRTWKLLTQPDKVVTAILLIEIELYIYSYTNFWW